MKKEINKNTVTKEYFSKPGNMVYPVPAVLVSCADKDGKANLITIAWTGTICSDPAMLYISVRKERHSYEIIKNSGEFVLNLTTEKLAGATDYCGCTTGSKVDKFKECSLTPQKCSYVSCPAVLESPVSIECKVTDIIPLGSHDMFLARVEGISVDSSLMDEKVVLHLENAGLIAYSHGKYRSLGDIIGKFGYSVQKKK